MNGLEAQFRIAEIEISQSTLDEKIIGVFRYESESKTKRGPILLILAEIFSNLYVYEQLLDVINETAERTRHLTAGVDADPMARFEKLIQKLNEGVAQFLKEEPTPITWNRVNLFVLELSEGHISLAGIGRLTNVFLQKQADGSHRSFDLLGSLEQPAIIQPEKPFASLICGDISPGDLLFIGTQNFERLRNEIQLVDRLKASPPVSAALEIKQLVEQQNIPDDFAAIVAAHVELPTQTPTTLKKMVEAVKNKSTESVEKMHQEVQNTQAMLSPSLPPITAAAASLNSPLPERLKKQARLYSEQAKDWVKGIVKKAPILKDPISLASLRGMNAGHGAFMTKKRKLSIAGGIAIVLLIAIGTLAFSHAKQTAAEQALWTAVYDQAFDRKTRAEADLVYGNEERARAYLTEARNLLTGLDEKTTQRKTTKSELDQSLAQLEVKLRRELAITHPTQVLSGVGEDTARAVAVWKNVAYALSADGTAVIQIDLASSAKFRIPLTGTSGTATGITASEDGVFVLLQPAGLLKIDTTRHTASAAALNLSKALGSQAITFYNRRIYSLDAAGNMVWKYANSGGNFGQESTYLKQNTTDLTNAVSLAIDSNIYIGKQDGTVARYLSGAQETWSLHSISPPLTSLTSLWTDPNTDRIVISDLVNKRVLVFRKDGQLIAQITSPDFQAPQNVFGDSGTKKIYLADQQRLFVLDLP